MSLERLQVESKLTDVERAYFVPSPCIPPQEHKPSLIPLLYKGGGGAIAFLADLPLVLTAMSEFRELDAIA